MDELKRIKEKVSPNEIILTVDAMTGQDAVNVAKTFDEALGINSVLISKLDSDTRGGAALSVLAVTGKPVKFVGTGEKLDDFDVFHPDRMAKRILGMGDVMTLIEKAEEQLNARESEKLAEKVMSGKGFDMNDLLAQLTQIQKMGSIKSLLGMLPGLGSKLNNMDIDERQFERIKAIITSMTKEERAKPSIINPQRKRRIATGSGTKVEDVNKLLNQFTNMQRMFKQLGGTKKLSKHERKRLAGMKWDPEGM
jgi:signal recognition particle subunit SRP54